MARRSETFTGIPLRRIKPPVRVMLGGKVVVLQDGPLVRSTVELLRWYKRSG